MICPKRLAMTLAGLVVLVSICPAGSGYRVPGTGYDERVPGTGYDERVPGTGYMVHGTDGNDGIDHDGSSSSVVTRYPVPGTQNPVPQTESNASYWTYDNMTAELQRLAKEHQDIVHLYDLTSMIDNRFGFKKTWEDRIVWGVCISNSTVMNDPGRPRIVIECSHHGDEWMGFETGRKLIEVLVNGYHQKEVQNVSGINASAPNWSTARLSWLVDNRDIWVIPMVNPDGTTQDQLQFASGGGIWRKNTRDNDGNGQFDPSTDGVNLNRNYPYMWGANMKGVISSNGISITQDTSVWSNSEYHGPMDNFDDDGDAALPGAPDWWPQHRGPDWNGIDEDPVDGLDNDGDGKVDEDMDGGFSEPETSAVEALFDALDSDGDHVNGRSDISISVSLHAYTGCVMWPWGYANIQSKDDALMEEIGTAMAAFPGYDAYQSVDMYATSGDTSDWFFGSMGSLAFVIELGKSGQGGFHPAVEMRDNISVPNVEALLYAAEISDVAKAASGLNMPSIEIGVPTIQHTPKKGVRAGSDLVLTARVANATNLRQGGLALFYRVDGGSWNRVGMAGDGKDAFKGVIPAQRTGTAVDYYFRAASVFNTSSFLPVYAPYDLFSCRIIGFEVPLWGWAAAGGAILVGAVAVTLMIRKKRLGTSVENR